MKLEEVWMAEQRRLGGCPIFQKTNKQKIVKNPLKRNSGALVMEPVL